MVNLEGVALSTEEKKQYHRHLILSEIGKEGQIKLKASKVLIIGAGGLGCPVLQYLTGAGVGTIGVVDGDVVDQSNLQRQILYTVNDIGKSKAVAGVERMKQLNPHIVFNIHNTYLNNDNAIELFQDYDIIVDGTDNFSTRYLVNDACVITKKPLVFGSIFKFQGQVSVFNFNNSGTYRCLYPEPPSPNSVPNCSDIGVLGVLSGIIGSLQANEVIKLITGVGSPLVNQLLYFDALTLQQQVLKFEKNKNIHVTALENDYDLFCGVKTLGNDNIDQMNNISAEAYLANKSEYNILDVRTYEEFEDLNYGGWHIPLDELEERMGELPNSKPMVVFCASGIRSEKAIQLLLENYFPKYLYNLEGGISTL